MFLLMPCFPAWAWSGPGHMVIAAEAYRQLAPGLKLKVTEILKSHPDYARWQESFTDQAPNTDLAVFLFMNASTWPDEIGRRHNHYDHPHWHYIDYPLKPPSFPMEPGPTPNDDVLYGLRNLRRSWGTQARSAEERAV